MCAEKEVIMKIMIQKRVTGLKGFVIFTLIIAMLVTLIPANALAQSHAYTTEDPNAELYPYPLDMKILSEQSGCLRLN